VDNESGGEETTTNGDLSTGDGHTTTREPNGNGIDSNGGRIVELLQEERDRALTPDHSGNGINPYKSIPHIDDVSEDGSSDILPRRAPSPLDSIPDDSPSVQVFRTPIPMNPH
jgi:hypothetical protein